MDPFIRPVSVKPDFEENWARVSPITIKTQTNNLEFQLVEIARVKVTFSFFFFLTTSPYHRNRVIIMPAVVLLLIAFFTPIMDLTVEVVMNIFWIFMEFLNISTRLILEFSVLNVSTYFSIRSCIIILLHILLESAHIPIDPLASLYNSNLLFYHVCILRKLFTI